ncbi:MAG: hypothetical protein WC505_04945 [Patescibacteria group bacterium]
MATIRRASRQDSQQVSDLLAKKFSFPSLAIAEKTFRNECAYQHYRIAEEHGRVVGLVSWKTEGLLSHGVAELCRLALDAAPADTEYVKEMLFDQVIAEADYFYKQRGFRLRKIFSMIHADNREIKEFFLNKGMQQEAILRNHYHNGTDELIFSLFFA